MPPIKPALKKAALNAVGKANYAAIKAGEQVAQAAKTTKGIAVLATKSIPAAAKNTVTNPIAAAKGAGKAIKNITASGTVRGPAMARRGEAGASVVASGLVATGLQVPVGAVLGAAKAKKK